VLGIMATWAPSLIVLELLLRSARVGNESRPTTPGEFKARLRAEIETWTKVVTAANIERI